MKKIKDSIKKTDLEGAGGGGGLIQGETCKGC